MPSLIVSVRACHSVCERVSETEADRQWTHRLLLLHDSPAVPAGGSRKVDDFIALLAQRDGWAALGTVEQRGRRPVVVIGTEGLLRLSRCARSLWRQVALRKSRRQVTRNDTESCHSFPQSHVAVGAIWMRPRLHKLSQGCGRLLLDHLSPALAIQLADELDELQRDVPADSGVQPCAVHLDRGHWGARNAQLHRP